MSARGAARNRNGQRSGRRLDRQLRRARRAGQPDGGRSADRRQRQAAAGGSSAGIGPHGGAVTATGASLALGSITTDAGDATSDPLNGSGESGGAVTLKATASRQHRRHLLARRQRPGARRRRPGRPRQHQRRPRVDCVDHGARREPERAGRQRDRLGSERIDHRRARSTPRAPPAAMPARRVARAAPIFLAAAHGPLTLGGRLRSEGGPGGSQGAPRWQRRLDRARRAVRSPRPPACSRAAATAAPGAPRRQRRPRARLGAAPVPDPPAARRLDRRHAATPNGDRRPAAGRVGADGPRRSSRRRARSRSRRTRPTPRATASSRASPARPPRPLMTTKTGSVLAAARSLPASRPTTRSPAFHDRRRLAERPDRAGQLHGAARPPRRPAPMPRSSRSACRS